MVPNLLDDIAVGEITRTGFPNAASTGREAGAVQNGLLAEPSCDFATDGISYF
jgi:hypothetical protein